MAGEVKIINEEQYDLLLDDIAKLIGQIQLIQKDFDGKKMREDVVNEFKLALRKNSLFKSLEKESLELEQNLDALKNVRKEFWECKNKSEIRLIIASLSSMFVGGVISILMMWFMGKFG